MKEYTSEQLVSNGILVDQTFNSFKKNESDLAPAPIGEEINQWNVIGCVKSNDFLLSSLIQPNSDEVFYGYLLQSKTNPNNYTLTVRGTGDASEWLDDCKFLPEYHEGVGFVEAGFYDIYQKMQITTKDGKSNAVSEFLANMLNNNADMHLTITGHSLGSAIATYITYNVCKEIKDQEQVDMCLFASPKPGTGDFTKNFDAITTNYAVYNYSKDAVPDTPPSLLGYTSLSQLNEITPDNAQAIIKDNLLANHHVISYCAMLDYEYTKDWTPYLTQNGDSTDCIIGANPKVIPSIPDNKNKIVSMIKQTRDNNFTNTVPNVLKHM